MLKNPKLEKSLGPYLGKAARVIEKRINENFEKAGKKITRNHWVVLVHLWKKDGQNQTTLCDYAGRNKTTITRTIDSLEKQNYVLRVPDSNDRRNKLIYLTHKGKQAQEALSEIMLTTLEEATAGIAPAHLDICKQVLHQVFLNLADEETLERFSKIVPNETISNENRSDKPKSS